MAKNSISHYNHLFNTLRTKGPSTPFLLFWGDEDYLKRVAIQRIEKFLDGERISFFGNDTTKEEIAQVASNQGLFRPKRVIVIYEFEKLKQKDEVFKMRPSPGTYIILIISSSYDKKKTKDLLKKYKNLKHLTVYEFSTLDFNGFKVWVKSRLQKNNKEADDKTFNALIKRLPQNLTLADIELRKLFLYMGEDHFLDMHHLEVLSYESWSSLQGILLDIMGYEKFNLSKIAKSMSDKRSNQLIYEIEAHFARIIDANLNTFFSDRYRSSWRISPYKRHKMLHTTKDAAKVLSRLLKIEYATKTSLRNEQIIKNYILLSLLP